MAENWSLAGKKMPRTGRTFIPSSVVRYNTGDISMPMHEPAQETTQADSTGAGSSAVLPVREVVEIVREWVDLHARHLPDFAGAYLWAGITALPPDAPFPLYRDVDVVVVLPQGAQDDTVEVRYRGVMLEVISIDLE